MSYHSNTKTVLIVLLITILFFLASFLLLFKLNLTSPTLIVTDYLMNRFSSADSDLSFSFENMERNFRDRVMIRNLTVCYRGEEIAFFDTVEVKLGLFDMISYFLNLEGSAEVDFRTGSVKLDPILEKREQQSAAANEVSNHGTYEEVNMEDSGASPFLFLSSHTITFSFSDVEVSAGNVTVDVDMMDASYIGDEQKLIAEASVPSVSFISGDTSVVVRSVSLSLSYGDTLFLTGDADGISFVSETNTAEAEGISFSAGAENISSVSSGLFNAVVDLSSLSGSLGTLSLSLDGTELVWKDNIIYADSSSLSLSSGSISASLSSLSMELDDFDDYTVSFSSMKIGDTGAEIFGEGVCVNGRITTGELYYSLSSAGTDVGEKTKNRIGEIAVNSINGKVSYRDGFDCTVALSAVLGTPNQKIDDITFSLDAHIYITDGKLSGSMLTIKDLYLGYGEKYDSTFSVTGDLESADISLYYGAFGIDLTLSVMNRTLYGDISIDNLELMRIVPLFSDKDISLFDSTSVLSLKASLDLEYRDYLYGKADYSIQAGKLSVGFLETDLSSEGSLTFEEDKILLSGIRLDTGYFSLDADGYWDMVEKLPTLDFSVSLSSGNEILSGYIHLSESGRIYSYYGVFPTLASTYISGDVDFSVKNEVKSTSVLMTNGTSRPFSLSVDLEKKQIAVLSESLSIRIDYSSGLKGSLRAESLETLHSPLGVPIILDGSLDFGFTFEDGLEVSSTSISISDIFILPSSPSVTFRFSGRDTVFNLDDILVMSDGRASVYTGRASVDLDQNILAFSLREEDGEGSVVFSLYKDEEFVAALKADSIDLSMLGLEDMYCSLSLFGRAKKIEDFSFDGNITVESPTLESRRINADITINGYSLTVENVVYSSDSLTSELDSLSFDSETGKLSVSGGSVSIPNEKAAGAMPISLTFSLSGETTPSDSLVSTALDILKNGGKGSSVRFDIETLDINSDFNVTARYLVLSIEDGNIYLSGNFLTGSYSVGDRKAVVSIVLEDIIDTSIEADFTDGIDANVKIDRFNMSLVNLIMKYPTVVFRDDMVNGEVSFTRKEGVSSLNGYLTSEELGVDIFWIEDQEVILHNPRFVIWNNDLRCSLTYATVFDELTNERKMIKMDVAVTMNESLSIESWEADVYMDENNRVRVRIPLHPIGIDILGYVTGHYHVKSDENGMMNEGELYLSDTDVSIGMNPFPEWYKNIKGGALMDLTLHFENNNRVLYPAGDDPIFSITLQEDSSVYAYRDALSFFCSGNVQIRGGEIYYFQKYFYITAGSLSFDDPTTFNPKINLRATLRDYDSSSEKVEIYLVMKDNTFDNLSPTLESSPTKELSEIMEILGQSILSSDTYGSMSVSSVASLVTEGFDILSRLGIVTTASNPLSSLSSSLKSVFGVDTFSLHSNILNNIVTDTISQATQNSVGTYSPMARFLSGTTLNIGKYLSQNLYLQIMVHLEARKNGESYTIISDDLALDTEISLEWANSAFTVTFFTRPSYFSFYSILSTFGFSISKTINF